MSIICVLKEKDTLILSTDSRMMAHDFSGVAYDSQQKIFEIAPDTYIAMSGRLMASEFQVARARELAAELGTTDIQVIGAALAAESLPCLTELVEQLRLVPDETTKQHVSGGSLLHGCVLAGRSGGKLGYVLQTYRVQAGGTIKCEADSYFEAPRKITFTSGGSASVEIASQFMQNPATWIDPLEYVSTRFLETMKRATPTIGGPWQVVRLNGRGSRWISRPQAAVPLVGNLAAATILAAISMTAPTISVTGGGGAFVINIDATNGFMVTKGSVTAKINTSGTLEFRVSDSGAGFSSYVQSTGFAVFHPTYGGSSLGANQVFVNTAAGVVSTLTGSGFTQVNSAAVFTGTLAAAITAGKNVQGGIIMA